MDKSKFLARVVTAALLSGTAFGSAAWEYCSDTGCEVIGYPDPYDVDCPYYWGCDGDHDPWDPPGDHGGDNGGGGGGGGNNEPNLAVCLELQTAGLPPDCDRNLANSAPRIPTFSNPWQLDEILAPYQNNSFLFNSIDQNARFELVVCYGNITIQPAQCEAEYLATIQSMSTYMNQSQQQLLNAAMISLQNRMSNAATDRAIMDFFTAYGGRYAFRGISFNFNAIITNILTMPQYNRVLFEARKQKVCNTWMTLWDQSNCN
ncbi:MAG: hypothetical protein RBT55_15855 [Rhodocyclaceae bacterium]|nr:hypothetical protein [Rhodocyclaceae bacterium]HRP76661.1 hypothetical protein [Rhodocyclaceae bacterium]HRQ35126.1 hypothetical protein [Chiayiivirga sp.]